MKGYTIQHSIELLEKEAGSGSGGASTAAQVSFDNTGTGLVATNVQTAITEVNSKGVVYSTTEKVIGVWIDGTTPVYEKTIDCGPLPNNATKNVAHEISNLDLIVGFDALSLNSTGGYIIPLPYINKSNPTSYNVQIDFDATNINLFTAADRTGYDKTYVTMRYTKTAPVTNTRSKKSK